MRLGRSWRRAPGTPTVPTNSFALAPRVGPSPRALRAGEADTSFFLPSATRPSRQSEIRGFGSPPRGGFALSGCASLYRPEGPIRYVLYLRTAESRWMWRPMAIGERFGEVLEAGPNRRRVGA